MNLKYLLIVFGLVVAAGIGTLAYHHAHSETTYPVCMPAQNELCPTHEFVDALRYQQQLNDEVLALKKSGSFNDWQHKQWELSGLSLDLQRSVPNGYRWEDSKYRFVALAPAAQPTPTPAVVNKK